MKVTVCFGNIRVVVPCGDGDILVRDLIRESTLRYKKATGKGSDSWVAVHNLQSQSGGGILDPDDRLSDVADDRETIIANFEDGDGVHHGGGDGASGSSVGTGSPDIFHESEKYSNYPNIPRNSDIEITSTQLNSPLLVPLQVRRGSEPNLNQLPPTIEPPKPPDPSKRWSAAIAPGSGTLSSGLDGLDKLERRNGYPMGGDWEEPEEEERIGRITRDGSNRLSMQFLGESAGGYRWVEAAERANVTSKNRTNGSTSLPRDHRRKEPLGQANNSVTPTPNTNSALLSRLSPAINDTEDSENLEMIIIRNEPGPLGIHVVPDYDRSGKDRGLVVQGIEPGGRIDRDGRLAIYDRIIEINGQNLLNQPFQRVQEMFKLSLIATELRLKVIKSKIIPDQIKKIPNPIFPGSPSRRFPEDKENVAMVEAEQQIGSDTKVATVSPTKRIPGGGRNAKSLLTANTRKIGRKIELELIKGVHGLGFSITTRDNPAGGNCPIYIKNILPKGAAVEDGRLKPGDRLLEVNGIEMTGKSQAEAVAVLRNAPPGSKVRIIVSRQEDVTGPTLPREIGADGIENIEKNWGDVPPAIPPLPAAHDLTPKGSVKKIISQFQETAKTHFNVHEKSDDSLVFPWKHREILTFDIPVHDSEKAGLGVSVKGKTTQSANGSGSQDLGIFIKSVIHGGAASRDKRLRTNDQLLSVNGISLLNQSNSEAMETLRRAMLHTEGPVKGSITLTIARRANAPNLNNQSNEKSNSSQNNSGPELNPSLSTESENSTTDNSNASEGSGNTVIFLPYKQADISNTSIGSLGQNSPIGKGLNPGWNPVIDRITGQSNKNQQLNQLRNESYYMATHDTWSTSMLMGGKTDKLSSPTVNLPSGETVLIEEEYPQNVPQNRLRLGDGAIENRNEIEPDGKASNSCDKTSESNPPNATDATYSSQLSLENPQGFSRDAFGRQSMSEKRHATLDAKNTGTYQRNKKLREEREKSKPSEANLVRVGSVESVISLTRSPNLHSEYADKLGELGPSLGMKKSSSLESLQTMVQEIQMQEEGDPAYSYRGGQGHLKVIRGRGCDESFRAAVDIDYNKHLVDPNHRSETSAKKHWLLDPPSNRSPTEVPNEREIDGFSNVRGGIRQSSLNAVLDNKIKSKTKKPSILKGIGSMFRFGKHRKMDLDQISAETLEEIENPNSENQKDSGIQEKNRDEIYQQTARKVSEELQRNFENQNQANFNQNLRQNRQNSEDISKSGGNFEIYRNREEMSRNPENFSRNRDELRNREEASRNPEEIRRNLGEISRNRDELRNREELRNRDDNSRNPEDIRRNLGEIPRNREEISRNREELRNPEEIRRNLGEIPRNREEMLRNREESKNREDLRNRDEISRNRDENIYSFHQNSEIRYHFSQFQPQNPMSKETSPRNQEFLQQQHYMQQNRSRQRHDHPGMIPEGSIPPMRYREIPEMPQMPPNRSERVHNLRAQHQQRHAERQGQYPQEDREEQYEEVIRQRLEQSQSQGQGQSFESYREMQRPGSRSGITDPVPFNHYVNYDELHISNQNKLSDSSQLSESQISQMRQQVQQQRMKVEEESRKQHQYHSQRQPRSEFHHQRPVSNFYEYESVQSLIQGRGRALNQSNLTQNSSPNQNDQNSNSLPRNQPIIGRQYQPNNNNLNRAFQAQNTPYQRYQPQPNRNQPQNLTNGKIRGPFVTHVTIGEKGGSKV